MAMTKPIITISDVISSEGFPVVLIGNPRHTHNGLPIVFQGSPSVCMKPFPNGVPHGPGIVVGGSDIYKIDGCAAALEGHKLSCGCSLKSLGSKKVTVKK